jgi:YidC/Oxa1 family membrane protein insertase
MDKKTIIAFVLIGVIIFLWPIYMDKIAGKKNTSKEQTLKQQSSQNHQTEGPSQSVQTAAPSAVFQKAQNQPSVFPGKKKIQVHVPADTLMVETNLYQGKISNAGGGTIVGWKLKKYFMQNKQWVELIPDSANGNLSVAFDPSLDVSQTVFDVVLDSQWVEKNVSYRKICYARDFASYGRLEKEFIFADNDYDIHLQVRFALTGQTAVRSTYLLQWMSGLSPTEKDLKEEISFSEAVALQGGELLKTKSDNTGLREGSTRWVSVRTKYFLTALIPKGFEGRGAELRTEKTWIETPSGSAGWKRFGVAISAPLETGSGTAQDFLIYVGPMDYQLLKLHGVQLEKALSLGWSLIQPFSIAFMYSLQFLFKIVKNYGWAIVIFSILIKVLLYPLTKKSYDSMKQMQELQPKLKALQEKYKSEPQKLNAETMKLYKAHGINPMSGCLPLILQMPILFALFNLFRTTIMFRQAGFLGIIKDLSRPDHIIPIGNSVAINLLPILMGITMFIQQKKTVTDPKQKFMSYFMSFFMIYIFYNLSAGLNLYYFMFNILTIAQDTIIKKHPVQEAQSA